MRRDPDGRASLALTTEKLTAYVIKIKHVNILTQVEAMFSLLKMRILPRLEGHCTLLGQGRPAGRALTVTEMENFHALTS